jgi:hypothetical protein
MNDENYINLLKRLEKFSSSTKIFSIGLGGICLTASQFIGRDFIIAGTNLSNTLFIIGIIITTFSWFVIWKLEHSSATLVHKIHSLENTILDVSEECQFYKNQSGYVTQWNSLIFLTRELVDKAIRGEITLLNKKSSFENILEFIVERKYSLFEIKDEYWNLAIYEYIASKDQLECVACLRSRQSEANRPHRAWRIGEGHVGRTFERAKSATLEQGSELICSDATNPDVAAWMSAGPKSHSTDAERYVSLAAFPVALELGLPLGVLILTSDQPERFNLQNDGDEASINVRLQNAEPLREIAAMIAQIMFIMQSQESGRGEASHGSL